MRCQQAQNSLSQFCNLLPTLLWQIPYLYVVYSNNQHCLQLVVTGNPLSYERRHRCLTFSRLHPTALKQVIFITIKTKLNIGKCAFSPTIWNQLPLIIKSSETNDTFCIKKWNICLRLLFHHTFSAVPCSNDNFCLSPCVTSQMILFVASLSLTFQGYRHYRRFTIIIIV